MKSNSTVDIFFNGTLNYGEVMEKLASIEVNNNKIIIDI